MMTRLYYLGPQGSFTHQAAMAAVRALPHVQGDLMDPLPMPCVADILRTVHHGEGWGVIAWENNVEGYVVPNLDALIDAESLAAFLRITVDVSFDVFIRPEDDRGTLDQVLAHPHGLAQCRKFIAKYHLKPVITSSNAAACRDITAGQVALGPSICGQLYGLERLASGVQDYRDAHTDFLVVARRDDVRDLQEIFREGKVGEFQTILAFIPLQTGAGVLAEILDILRDDGLNMTSFMSRPIKGRDGTYSFIATIDAAPWQSSFQRVLSTILKQGVWVKVLAVYPREERPDPPVTDWMLPEGGIHLDHGKQVGAGQRNQSQNFQLQRELLW